MKLSDIPDTPAAEPADDRKPRKLSQVGGDQKGASAPASEGGSALGALWRGFVHGMGDAVYGGAQIGARMAQAPQIGQTAPEMPGGAARIDDAVRQRALAYQNDPRRMAHPIASGIGRVGGNIASTLPLAALPGGQATIPGRMLAGAAAGMAGASTAPVEGQDFWKQKAAQIAAGAVTGGGIGGVSGALAPRGAAAMMSAAGVPLTAGMRTGMRPLETALQSFPVLGSAIRRGEMRTLDGFNRATVDQALEPIGATVPRNIKSGHSLIEFGQDQLSKAYDKVLPHVSFSEIGWQQIKPKVQAIADELSTDHAQRLARFIKNRVTSRFDNGVMDGRAFKTAESELTNKAYTYGRGTQDAELGDALQQVTALMRESLVQQNPAHGPELQNINSAYAMFSRVRQAASGATSEGKFTPADLLRAARRQSGAATFARGDALMQTFAEAGDKAIGKSHSAPPNQGLATLTHLLTLGGGGGAVLGGTEGAGIGGAVAAGAPIAAYGALKGASALGRGPVGGIAAAAGGRMAAPIPRVADRMRAARKVGDINTRLYAAKRRGDLAEVQKLTSDLSAAQSEYNRLRPAQ